MGIDSEGNEFVALNFTTTDDSHNDVITYRNSRKEIDKILKSLGKHLVKHVRTETYKQNGKIFTRDEVTYTLEDLKD